jgi:acyl carrier protein
MSETVEALLLQVVRDHCPAETRDTVSLDTPLEATGIDSLGMAEIMFAIEDAFDVDMPEPDGATDAEFRTLREVYVAIVHTLSDKKAAAA